MKNYLRDTQARMARMHEIRKENMEKYHKRFNPAPEMVKEPFVPGELVLKRLPREATHKLSLKWDGPFVIKKRLTPKNVEKGNVYIIADHEGTEEKSAACDLKKYVAPKASNRSLESIPEEPTSPVSCPPREPRFVEKIE